MRHRERYQALLDAATCIGDGGAARAWDYRLIRTEADIRGVEDDILARPIYSVTNIIDRAIVAHGRGLTAAFVAGLVRNATQA
jgi:hypothetical protein